MSDRTYRTINGDMLDLIAFREYGISSRTTEVLLDANYRIADLPIQMPSGVIVDLVPQTPLPERTLIHLWN